MSIQTGTTYRARYLRDASQVVIDTDYYDITGESEDYIALFRTGRSVYTPGVGSQYEPARIFFGRFVDGFKSEDTGEHWVDISILLDSQIRRR